MAIELRQFRYFVAVADAGQVSLAARRLHLAQPALSQALHKLEADLGVELLRRHPRGVELTECGKAFLDQACTTIAAADRAVQVASLSQREEIVVGFLQFALSELPTAILNELRFRRPKCAVRLTELNFAFQTRAVREKRVDAAFLWPPHDDPELEFEPLTEEPRIAVLPISHPLAAERSVKLEQIAEDMFLGAHPALTSSWADYWNLTPERGHRPATTDDAPLTVAEAVGSIALGRGITSAPAPVARHYSPPGIAFVPLSDVEPAVLAFAYGRDNSNPSLGLLLEFALALRGRHNPLALAGAGC